MQLDDLGNGVTSGEVEIFPGRRFQTSWRLFNCLDLAPGKEARIAADELCEHGYIVVEGVVELVCGGMGREVQGPAVLLAKIGGEHAINNRGGESARLVHMSVATGESVDAHRPFRVEPVDLESLRWSDAIHRGAGRIATRHLWGPEDFHSSWAFVDHAVLESRSSVGYHYHDALEECFLVLKGRGFMTIDDETFAVGPNSVTWQGIGTGHGIYNPAAENLEFLRLAVAQEDREFTTIDLHDDLSGRSPQR